MSNQLDKAKEELTHELGRLSSFAGFNKAMGQIYGLLYLSKEPVSLGEIADQLGISKGNASLNIRMMERWRVIQPVSKKGDRKDYYQAETDFWKIVHDIINERDRKEIDHTLNTISSISDLVKKITSADRSPESSFYNERLDRMMDFGNAISQMVQAFLTFDNFRMKSPMQSIPGNSQSHHIEIE